MLVLAGLFWWNFLASFNLLHFLDRFLLDFLICGGTHLDLGVKAAPRENHLLVAAAQDTRTLLVDSIKSEVQDLLLPDNQSSCRRSRLGMSRL